MSLARDIDLLYELGALRLIPRHWQRFHMTGAQNLAEHHFRVVWLALVIAAREGKGDTGKIVKMALAHDIAESRTGDVDHISRQYADRHEEKALNDMLKSTSLEAEFKALLEEYEARQSIEAKIVKDADNLDVDMELMEQRSTGHTLPTLMAAPRKHVGTTKLFTKTAKQMHAAIWKSQPHNWHLESPNVRWKGGDWKN